MLALLLSYGIGVFPSGFLVGKLHGVDIAHQGSANVGATNVARTIGAKAGVATLLLDIGKGVAAVILLERFGSEPMYRALFVCLGHCVSIPPLLKGGKGAATALGALIAVNFLFGISIILGFAIMFWKTRIVSISTLAAAAVTTVVAWSLGSHNGVVVTLIAALIAIRHYENIVRLIKGEEKQFSAAKNLKRC